MLENRLRDALTFDDVLLVPGYAEFLPSDADVSTQFTKGLALAIPFLSSIVTSFESYIY